MSTHQQSKPSLAKWSMAEESGRPGTCRSNVGCEAIDEPCTNRIVPRVFAGSPRTFSNRNRRTSPSFVVQCSSARMAGFVLSFMARLRMPLLEDLVELALHRSGLLLDLGVVDRHRL